MEFFQGAQVEVGTGARPLVELNNTTTTTPPKADTLVVAPPEHDELVAQSGRETTNDNRITSSATQSKEENVTFRDQNPSYSYEVLSEMDPTRMLQDSTDAELGNFFSRPIKIYEKEWSTSTTLANDFDP